MTFMEAKLDPMFPEGSAEHLVRFGVVHARPQSVEPEFIAGASKGAWYRRLGERSYSC